MTPEEVSSLVKTQIGVDWSHSNAGGVDLRECLVTPHKFTFISAIDDKPAEAWVVLLEHPHRGDGYAVVFDELSGEFGLAQFAEGYEPSLLGWYGDFFEALEAM